MRKLKHILVRIPIIGTMILYAFRTKIALGYFCPLFSNLLSWLFKSRETTNFTYDLTTNNKRYLSSLIANITGKNYDEILNYIHEIEEDKKLKQHIKKAIEESDESFMSDKKARFGRRIGWYAFVRAIKPKIVIETGVDKGLGSCILTSALMKNKEEGYEGYYYGTDINPNAGYLLSGDYKGFGEILYGDSIKSLENFNKTIDIFINDSDHSAEYEAKEYETVANKIAHHSIILGDNAHITDKLLNFALATGRRFIFFQEKPLHHWYPGGGIGIAFNGTTENISELH